MSCCRNSATKHIQHDTSTGEINWLKRHLGVTAVLNLQTDDDFDRWNMDWPRLEAHYHHLGIEVKRVPVRDLSPGTLQILLPNCVEALSSLLDDGHRVLVHCNKGVNRSPSTVITYLHWVKKWDLAKAVDHVRSRRRCDPYMASIRLATDDQLKKSSGGQQK